MYYPVSTLPYLEAPKLPLGYIMIGFYVNYGKLPFVTHFE